MSPMLTLAANQWVVGGLVVLGILASLAMILTILIQRPQGGGLAAAFGGAGAGSGQTAFGAKTGDALTIMTIIVFIFWLLVSIGLVYATKRPDPNAAGAAQTAPAEGEPAPGATTDPNAPPAPPESPAAGSMDPARPPEATEAPAGDAAPVTPETGTPAVTPPGTAESAGGGPGDGASKTGDDAAKTDGGGR
jgi:preprotein translocase subunit SecG